MEEVYRRHAQTVYRYLLSLTRDGDLAEEETASVLFRKAVGSEDISGDYNEYASVTEQDVNGRTVTLKGDGKLTYLAIWTDGEFSYSVSVSNDSPHPGVLSNAV